MKKNLVLLSIILSLFLAICWPVCLFAGGAGHYPLGSESLLAGYLPPPGLYTKEYFYYYNAQNLNGNNGSALTLAKNGAKLDQLQVEAIAPRLLWISNVKILGWNYGMHALVPLVNENFGLNTVVGREHETRWGIGDARFSPLFFTYHSPGGVFHAAVALNFDLPTGTHNPAKLVNIGVGDYSISPAFAFTAFLTKQLHFSMFIQYAFNTPVSDSQLTPTQAAGIGNIRLTGARTHLTPGDEFMFDYGLGYALTPALNVGISGYYYQQMTDDYTGLGTVENNKGKVFAVGPAIAYGYNQWFFDFHVGFETMAQNRPQGITPVFTICYAFAQPQSAKKEETK